MSEELTACGLEDDDDYVNFKQLRDFFRPPLVHEPPRFPPQQAVYQSSPDPIRSPDQDRPRPTSIPLLTTLKSMMASTNRQRLLRSLVGAELKKHGINVNFKELTSAAEAAGLIVMGGSAGSEWIELTERAHHQSVVGSLVAVVAAMEGSMGRARLLRSLVGSELKKKHPQLNWREVAIAASSSRLITMGGDSGHEWIELTAEGRDVAGLSAVPHDSQGGTEGRSERPYSSVRQGGDNSPGGW